MRSSRWIVILAAVLSALLMTTAASLAADSSSANADPISFDVDNIFVEWDDDIFQEAIAPTASAGFSNVYVWTGSFTVRSSTTYKIEVTVSPQNWDNFDGANGTVVMNASNPAVGGAGDFANAFDIAITSRKGVADLNPANAVYTAWTTAVQGEGTELVDQEPNTLGLTENEFSHDISLALVLVDDPSVPPKGGAAGQPTAGYDAANTVATSRRFIELPTGTFTVNVSVTVTENLTGQP